MEKYTSCPFGGFCPFRTAPPVNTRASNGHKKDTKASPREMDIKGQTECLFQTTVNT
jgi:hypothetical protein